MIALGAVASASRCNDKMTVLQIYTQYLNETKSGVIASNLTLAHVIKEQNADDTPLSVAQAAKRMGISERRVRELCASGELRHTVRPIRIRPVDIQAYQAKPLRADWKQQR
jgi:excisionase family DNA binding protein